ncbi:MAG: class I adenylate-forming enzyme family protein [Solirubrobacteraceae bacterium]
MSHAPTAPESRQDDQLSSSLCEACERWAERPALTHRGRTLTYAQLWERILALAWSYRALGIGPGDRIVCQLPDCPEHLIAVGAAWACGAIHVGVHWDLTGPELSARVARTGAAALVFAPAREVADPLARLRFVRDAHPSLLTILHGHAGEGGEQSLAQLLGAPVPGPLSPAPTGPDDVALLLLSSGSTGTPKLVMETLPALWGKMALFADRLAPRPADVHLIYLPICHVFGLKLTLMALTSGGRVVLLDRFSPPVALRLAHEEQVTVLPGTPTHLTLLLRHLADQPGALDSVRAMAFAAAPPPPALIEELYARLDVELMHVYGCSEGFVTLTTDGDEIRRGSAGSTVFRGPPGTPPAGQVAILAPERMAFLAPDEVGEIAFATASAVRYWDEPDAGADGWYRTGDLGCLDRDGCLTVSGRLRDVVNRGGLKVAAAEIEAALAGQPGVAECVVIPVPDPVLGEAICACVLPCVGDPTPSLAELRSGLAPLLARHKLPDELCLLDSLPRLAVGKLDRAALTALVVGTDRPRERHRPRPEPTTTVGQ